MDLIRSLVELLLHIDRHLDTIIRDYGVWTNALLFAIVFCETGLIVTPFLPGDSLLFAAGTFAARGALDPNVLFLGLSVAAIIGDTVNYWVGRSLGPRAQYGIRFVKQEHLDRTHAFFEKHGGKTIILARFIPIIRTFAPFVAGVGAMDYPRFVTFNVVGGVLWVGLFVYGGYAFGNTPIVARNFGLVIVAIVILSVLPAVIEYLRHRRHAAA
jgi:membrane-associated protein